MHPNADQLSTFVEGAASAHEREQMLAHLAECAECRRVVFLMRRLEETPPPEAQTARGWTWRWLVPVGLAGSALACGLAIVVYVRMHRGAGEIEGQNARVQAPVAPRNETPAGTGGGEAAARAKRRSGDKVRRPTVAGAASSAGKQPSNISGGLAGREQGTAGSVSGTVAAGGRIAGESAGAAAEQASPPTPEAAKIKQLPLGGSNAAASQSFATAKGLPALRIQHDRGPDNGMSEVRGLVTDQTGALVAGATVTLRDAAGEARQTTSSADGSFSLAGVPPGHYDLNVIARGFKAYQRAMDLKPRDMAELDTTLTVGTASETVTVEAAAPVIETSATSVASVPVAELPSRMPPQTTVMLGKRVLSLDSAGTLFVSHNGGKSWRKVKLQWTGKVVQIELANADHDLNPRKKAGAEKEQGAFQLTTDSGAVWISDNGTHWRAR
jgi:hypothetical protein